jgi:hypothetical protein
LNFLKWALHPCQDWIIKSAQKKEKVIGDKLH